MDALLNIPFDLDPVALQKKAHIQPGSEDAADFLLLVDKVQAVAHPKVLIAECFVEQRGDDWVQIGGVRFTSRALRLNLDQVQRVFPYVATCGREVDAVELPAGDFMQPFWLDILKTSLLESASRFLMQQLSQRYQVQHASAMHPGSADLGVWAIEEQRQLFDLLGGVEPLIGVTLTESCLMLPNKSVSGILFPTEVDFRSCQVCQREHCPSRGAPFDTALWQKIQNKEESGLE